MKARVFLLVGSFLLVGLWASASQAVVTTDGTLGAQTTLTGPNYSIPSSLGQTRGNNLFHSFGQFSLLQTESATFSGPSSIVNILARVTGGLQSQIFGTIDTRTSMPSANLYLVNPAGILFGSTASLNVGGSFHASTADYVKMSDGNLFIANPIYENAVTRSGTIATVLSSADPAAFGFLSSNPAPITILGSALAVDPGQAISFVGGDITVMGGTLTAPSGQINLVSVASPGEVLLPTFQTGPNVNGDSFTAMGSINLAGASLDVSGDPAGTVLIRGGQLVMDNSLILADNQGALDGAPIGVDIDVTSDITLINASTIAAFADFTGRGGDIVVKGGSLTMNDGSLIATFSFDAGDAGSISVNAGTLTLANASAIQSSVFAAGRGGDITVIAGDLNLLNGGLIDTDTGGTGSAGNITVNATGTVSLSGMDSFGSASHINSFTVGSGNTGNISVAVGRLELQDSTSISILSSLGSGQTGDMSVIATESITLSNGLAGGGLQVVNSSHMLENVGTLEIIAPTLTMNAGLILTRNEALGNAGPIILQVGNLNVAGGSRIDSDVSASGRGGDIRVVSDAVSVSGPGSGFFSENLGFTGRGGNIQIQARQVMLNSGATISAQSLGTGNAGNIQIAASDSLVLQGHSSITTATTLSDGGNITIQAGRLVRLTDSTITTSVQGGTGNGGNITIDPTFVILQRSQIIANAFGGNGGNILIVADMFFTDPFSVISASSTLGINGTVNIQAPITNLSGTLAPLSEEFLQAAGLLRASCAARFQGGNVSSFVVAGRDGMPLEPGGLLPSPLFIENSGSSRLAGSLNVPDLRVGRSFGEQDLTLAALSAGCAS